MSKKYVYWEKQGNDRMCGLHCINSMLQGPYYNEELLAVIGKELDDQEKEFLKTHCASSGEIIRHNSLNVLEDGFINISVLVECLKRKNILLKNVSENDLIKIITNDHHQDIGYICNLREHWFSVRKIHNTWFILDSLKKAPLYIKGVQLKLYFNDVIKKYHVFAVHNENPYVSLPKPDVNFQTKNPNQFYIPISEIKEVAGTANDYISEDHHDDTSGGENFGFLKKEKQKEFKWPENGGRKLSDTTNENTLNSSTLGGTRNILEDTDEDEQMQMALKLSMQEYAKNMPPPMDVPEDEGRITIMIKFPKKRIKKKFSPKQTIADIFYWIEYESSRDHEMDNALLLRNSYTMYQVFPRRKFVKCLDDTSIQLHTGNKVEQVMSKTLEELNFEHEETFILS